MFAKKICPFCGRRLYGGKSSNYITCYVCKVEACRRCSKYGFCLPHYNKFTDAQKKKIKSNSIVFIFLEVVLPVLFLLMIIPYAIIYPDSFKDIPESTTILFAAIFVVFLLIYVFSRILLKDRKVHKILQGFEI